MTTYKENPFGLLKHPDSEEEETQTKVRQKKVYAKEDKSDSTIQPSKSSHFTFKF